MKECLFGLGVWFREGEQLWDMVGMRNLVLRLLLGLGQYYMKVEIGYFIFLCIAVSLY